MARRDNKLRQRLKEQQSYHDQFRRIAPSDPIVNVSETRLKNEIYALPTLSVPSATPPVLEAVVATPTRKTNPQLFVLAYLLGIVGLGINAWFAWSRGTTLPDKVLLSSLGFITESVMFFLPNQVSTLWQNRNYGGVLIACVVWPVLFTFALSNSLGFASLNLSEVATARAQRITPEVGDAQRKLDTLTASRASECLKRGDRCRQLEKDEQTALESLSEVRERASESADPQVMSATKLLAWLSVDRIRPSQEDFTMFRLLLLTLLPQLGGVVLMVSRK